jgi:hypothetical protein
MVVMLDGVRLNRPEAADLTLQGLVDQVRADLLTDRLIVAVARNGAPLVDDALSEALSSPLAGEDQIELVSADRFEVAVGALREAGQALSDVARAQPALAGQLQQGRSAEAFQGFGEFIQVWQAARQTLEEASQLLHIDLTQLSHDGQSIRASLDDLAGQLRELRAGFEARDYVLLSDMMAYDLPALCQRWERILAALAEQVAGLSARRAG